MELGTLADSGPKRATLIGADGFIGTALRAKLDALDWSLSVPDRHDTWKPAGPLGHIFYCAGLTADYARRPVETVEAHVGLLSRVLSSQDWESLIYLSSTRLYDGQPAGRSGTEDGTFVVDPDDVRNLYDLSKLLGENLCRVMGHGKARVARLSCVYRDERDPGGFIGNLLLKVLNTPPGSVLSVDSSPYFQRDYVHVDDVVAALPRIALAGASHVYNVAFGSNVSNAELADVLLRYTGVRIKFTKSDAPVPSPAPQRKRLTDEFGWHSRSLQHAIATWAERHGLVGGASA